MKPDLITLEFHDPLSLQEWYVLFSQSMFCNPIQGHAVSFIDTFKRGPWWIMADWFIRRSIEVDFAFKNKDEV